MTQPPTQDIQAPDAETVERWRAEFEAETRERWTGMDFGRNLSGYTWRPIEHYWRGFLIGKTSAHAEILRMEAGMRQDAETILALTAERDRLREAALEEAARACEKQACEFLSPQYATGQPLSSFNERVACKLCATAIRALSNSPRKGE